MQTTGAPLLVIERCSLARVLMHAQDGRSAHGVLYRAAVRRYRQRALGPSQGQGNVEHTVLLN